MPIFCIFIFFVMSRNISFDVSCHDFPSVQDHREEIFFRHGCNLFSVFLLRNKKT